MQILELLNSRVAIAKSFTKDFQAEVKKCVADYKCKQADKVEGVIDQHLTKKRYVFNIPYIYSTHESMLSSLFEKPMELVLTGKGEDDEEKASLIKAVYKYLQDKLDLDEFMNTSAWWYILTGQVSSTQGYEVKINGYVPVNGANGEPMMDPEGKPVQAPIYEWNDPIVAVDNPEKTYFAPDSEYSLNCKKVPYKVVECLMPVDEIKSTYDEDVPPTKELQVAIKGITDNQKSDLKRAQIYKYSGSLSSDVKDELATNGMEWGYEKEYFAVFTTSKLLYIEEKPKYTTMAKWFSAPNEFFGFGIGKTLRSVQKEMSMRRGQQIRYADLYAFPWLTHDLATVVDQNSIQDVQKRKPLAYSGKPPAYLVPPEMPRTITEADNIARSDAQFISGTLDMSKGAQETNTVKTATGQQLFAQSQDKRMQKARKTLAKYYREVVINLFKLCRDNWDEEKIISITDEDGNQQEFKVSGTDLQNINFDTDIDISLESLSVNKDTIAERTIALYDKVKDDPLVDRKKVFAKMLREGYNIKNPESYMLAEDKTGTQPTPAQASLVKAVAGAAIEPGAEQGAVADVSDPQAQPEAADNLPLLGNEMAPNPNANPYVNNQPAS